MGMRKYERQIAKARLRALGVGNVNRQMHREQDGQKNWRRALTGETGVAALKAQIMEGMKHAKPKKPKRKLWRVIA